MSRRNFLCAVLFLWLVSFSSAQAPPRAKSTPIPNARSMTVMVFWANPPRSQETRPTPHTRDPQGSGVWIGKNGYIATCYHVVADWSGPYKIGIARDPYISEGRTTVSVFGAVNLFDATLVASDAAMDLAILKAPMAPGDIQLDPLVSGVATGTVLTPQLPISPSGAALETEFPQSGETLFIAGFPLPNTAQKSLIVQSGTYAGLFTISASGSPIMNMRFMLSIVSNPGNSGGPVFNADGRVVGLLEGHFESQVRDAAGRPVSLMQNSGISLAVPARLIEKLAKKSGISLE
jgi:putative serine protease PepD